MLLVLRMLFLTTGVLCVVLTAAACGTRSGSVGVNDGGPDVFDGGVTPDGNDGAPDATRCTGAYINGGDPCTTEGSSCIECEQGIGIGCTCVFAPSDGGSHTQWQCVGTEYPCPWM